LDSWTEGNERERARPLANLAGKVVPDPLADRLPASWWKKRPAGDSRRFIRPAARLLARKAIFMASAALVADGEVFPGIGLRAAAEEAPASAARLPGGGPPRAAVYPAEGAAFPRSTC
jgi:hypothetical protein